MTYLTSVSNHKIPHNCYFALALETAKYLQQLLNHQIQTKAKNGKNNDLIGTSYTLLIDTSCSCFQLLLQKIRQGIIKVKINRTRDITER